MELNDKIIDDLSMGEVILFRDKDQILEFDIKKYIVKVLENLKDNLIYKSWGNCNFKYIEDFNFIYSSDVLRKEFYQYIKNIIQSPYIKKIYRNTETRFFDNYLFDTNEIIDEIIKFIHFVPIPFDDVFGYSDKGTLDIYITIYDNNDDSLYLLGKLLANANDICYEIFHISSVYHIMNSDNKKFSDFYSNVLSQKKKEYVTGQKIF